MSKVTVSASIDTKVAERAMLNHRFYQAWTEGRLTLDALRAYARQYFHHVEAFPAEPGRMEVRLDEADPGDAKSVRRLLRKLQRRARQVRADHHAAAARQEQAELTGAAAHLQHRGILGNGGVEIARKGAP